MEDEDAKLVFVTVEPSTVGGVVEVGLLLVGLLHGFVGFVDSTVGLGFVTATVETSIDDRGPVFSVVVARSGLDTGFGVVVALGIFVGFGLGAVVNGFAVVVVRTVVGFTFWWVGLVVATLVVNF